MNEIYVVVASISHEPHFDSEMRAFAVKAEAEKYAALKNKEEKESFGEICFFYVVDVPYKTRD